MKGREPNRDYCVPVGNLREAAAVLGRKGGRAKSARKTAAVRENGRKRTTKLRALITQHGWLPGQDVEQWIGFSDLIAESTARKYEKKGWLKNIGHRVLTQEGYRNA